METTDGDRASRGCGGAKGAGPGPGRSNAVQLVRPEPFCYNEENAIGLPLSTRGKRTCRGSINSLRIVSTTGRTYSGNDIRMRWTDGRGAVEAGRHARRGG